MMWGWGNGNWGWGMLVPMMVMMLIFLAVVVWAVVMFTHSWSSRNPNHEHGERFNASKRILDERFARGEIDEDEYRKRKGTLNED